MLLNDEYHIRLVSRPNTIVVFLAEKNKISKTKFSKLIRNIDTKKQQFWSQSVRVFTITTIGLLPKSYIVFIKTDDQYNYLHKNGFVLNPYGIKEKPFGYTTVLNPSEYITFKLATSDDYSAILIN